MVAALVALGVAAPAAGQAPEPGELDGHAWHQVAVAARHEREGNYVACVAALATSSEATWPNLEVLGDDAREAVLRQQRTCTRGARALAATAMRKNNDREAIALMSPIVEHLWEGTSGKVTEESARLLNDLALAYHQADHDVACIRIAGNVWRYHWGDGVEYVEAGPVPNAARCYRGLAATYALRHGHCAIASDDVLSSVRAPSVLVPPGAKTACVALVRVVRTPETIGPDPCPTVQLVWKDAHGAIHRQAMPAVSHWVPNADLPEVSRLDDEYLCRGLSAIEVGTKAGKTIVRVHGDAQCHDVSCKQLRTVDELYEWNGQALVATLDLTI